MASQTLVDSWVSIDITRERRTVSVKVNTSNKLTLMEDIASSASSNRCFHLPVRVGRYVLTEELESGVFRAADFHSGHQLVCKVFDLARYRRALCAYSLLPAHPNINRVRDVVLGESRAFVFFNRSYGTLHALLRTRRRLREDTARGLFRQLLSSVAHCHDNGLVLRDLGPQKFVFVNRERTVLMLESVEDAVIEYRVQRVRPLLTSPSPSAYTSPEMEAPAGGVARAVGGVASPAGGVSRPLGSGAADVWALGAILRAMLFGCDSEGAGPARGGVVSPPAFCLIRSALHSDPGLRLSASELLTHPWLCSQPRSPPPHTHTHCHTHTPDQAVPT